MNGRGADLPQECSRRRMLTGVKAGFERFKQVNAPERAERMFALTGDRIGGRRGA